MSQQKNNSKCCHFCVKNFVFLPPFPIHKMETWTRSIIGYLPAGRQGAPAEGFEFENGVFCLRS